MSTRHPTHREMIPRAWDTPELLDWPGSCPNAEGLSRVPTDAEATTRLADIAELRRHECNLRNSGEIVLAEVMRRARSSYGDLRDCWEAAGEEEGNE